MLTNWNGNAYHLLFRNELTCNMAQWSRAIGDTLQDHPVGAVVDVLFHCDAVFGEPLHLTGLVAGLIGLLAVVFDFVNCSATFS